MKSTSMRFVTKGRVIPATVPRTRDPFVNTPLLSLGRDSSGLDRFWISTYNGVIGCLGVMVNESGEYRLYPFPMPHALFYGAALENDNTLWLCGTLTTVVRLDLRSGR